MTYGNLAIGAWDLWLIKEPGRQTLIISVIPLELDKAKAEGYKILHVKFLTYFLLVVALAAMVLMPAAVSANG
jgi:hypothetical protein